MSETEVIDLLREFLWAGVWIATPALMTALVIGVVIGLLQALTSVQELTLTFVPKLIGILLALILSMGPASRAMVTLFDQRVISVISGN